MCNKIAHTVVYHRLYQLHCGTSNSGYVSQVGIRFCNRPVLSNEGLVYCSMKQPEPLIEFLLMYEQTCLVYSLIKHV